MTWRMGTKCNLSLNERLRELGTIQPRAEKAQGHFINVYRYLIGRSKEDSLKRQVAPSKGTRGNRHKLKYKKFYLNTRKIFLYCENDRILKQIAQVPCRVSILGHIQNLTGYNPKQSPLSDPAMSRILV